MGLIKKAVMKIARPIYLRFFERPLWWFLARVKTYFFAETSERLAAIESRLTALETGPRMDDSANAEQWAAIEHLLLSILRQPRAWEPERDAVLNGIESNKCVR